MRERGVIIASGFMAGGALGGMLGAALRLAPFYVEEKSTLFGVAVKTPFFDNDPVSQIVSIGLFGAVCAYLWVVATRTRGRNSR